MNSESLKTFISRNAILLAVLVACLGFGLYRIVLPTAAPIAPPDGTVEQAPPTDDVAVTPGNAAPGQSEADRALSTIAEHQKKIDAAPQSEDTPGLLSAQGNLYMQKLVDYKEAARCYELLLNGWPDWGGKSVVYTNLSTCYERLNDSANKERVYRKMMEVFPQDSQEYQYAKSKLGL